MKEFENLKRVALSELKKLNAQYASKDEFTEADAKKYDYLMHGLKCQLTSEAMLEAEEYGEENGYSGANTSGRRGRGMNGQYISRGMSNRQSYDEGYSRGYEDGQSGHWPMTPYYPRNW